MASLYKTMVGCATLIAKSPWARMLTAEDKSAARESQAG